MSASTAGIYAGRPERPRMTLESGEVGRQDRGPSGEGGLGADGLDGGRAGGRWCRNQRRCSTASDSVSVYFVDDKGVFERPRGDSHFARATHVPPRAIILAVTQYLEVADAEALDRVAAIALLCAAPMLAHHSFPAEYCRDPADYAQRRADEDGLGQPAWMELVHRCHAT